MSLVRWSHPSRSVEVRGHIAGATSLGAQREWCIQTANAPAGHNRGQGEGVAGAHPRFAGYSTCDIGFANGTLIPGGGV
jgi:hypothetical protein